MLTIEDCIALSELTEDEIDAIASHENLPEMAAAEMGNYLIHAPEGGKRIRRIILDDIEVAQRNGNVVQSAKLKLVLKQFIEAHPEASVRKTERRT